MTDEDFLIRCHIHEGGEVVIEAGMLATARDHLYWRIRRDRWTGVAARLLKDSGQPDVLDDFKRAVRSPPTRAELSEDLPAELQGLKQAIALLYALVTDRRGRHVAS
jgi:hypothetical protein